ncbi:MAG TPA: hypothetical protein VLK34_06210 [Nocardioidaceae bacterium]|nr:hypothetical protein [Nocardioidaceae bacterium]
MDAWQIGRRGFLTLAGASVLAACSGSKPTTPVPSVTPTDLSPTEFPTDRVFYGSSSPVAKLRGLEESIGEPLPCYRSFFDSGEPGALHARVSNDAVEGRLSIASIKPPGPWADAAGDSGWIETVLGPLGDIGVPMFLAVHHEPEGEAKAYGTPADFRLLQLSVMKAASTLAPTATIVPILGSWSFDTRTSREPAEWNVPEATVYGVDIYNPWSPTNGKQWIPFGDKLALAHDQAAGRPMLVGEYGCRSDPAQPGRAASWMRDAFTDALASDVVAMAYFNSDRNSPDGTWELDAETFPVFRDLLHAPEVKRLSPGT